MCQSQSSLYSGGAGSIGENQEDSSAPEGEVMEDIRIPRGWAGSGCPPLQPTTMPKEKHTKGETAPKTTIPPTTRATRSKTKSTTKAAKTTEPAANHDRPKGMFPL